MVTYRTDDPARWGVGKGSNLTAPEIDGNFWELAQRLVAVETNPAAPNNISAITVTGSQMIVHMVDGSTHGPFTLPSAMVHYRGGWAPGVAYDELDVFAAPNNGGIYLVARAHTSAAAFDRAAVDANGNPLYQWLFPMAESGAATLGELGDVFVSAVELGQTLKWDGSVWVPGSIPSKLQDLNEVYFPSAPVTGQLLGWDGWQWTPVDAPSGGGAGQHMWRMRFVDSRTGFHNIREMEFRTTAGVARAATDAAVVASSRWGSPERAVDGATNNYASLDSPVAGEYIGAAFPQFMDVVEFALNPYLSGFTDVDFDIEHSTDGGLTWEVAAAVRGATLADGAWSTFPVAIPADSGGGSTTFLGLTDTPAAFGLAGQLTAVNAAGDALEFIDPPSGGGATDLTGLSDVTLSAPAAAQFLRHNGTEWANAALAWADIPDKPATFAPSAHSHPWAEVTGRPATIDAIPATLGAVGYVLKVDAAGTGLVWAPDDNDGTGSTALDNLTDVTISAPASGQVLKFNGTAWVNAADEGGTGSADLAGLSDVTVTTPVAANFLRHNGTEWVNAAALWADISDKPATFTPSAHSHPWADVSGKPATVAALPAAVGAAGQVMKAQTDGSVAWDAAFVKLTQAEYDALASKDPATMYVIVG